MATAVSAATPTRAVLDLDIVSLLLETERFAAQPTPSGGPYARGMTARTATLAELVERALAEDIGTGDVTTAATVPPRARGRATITQKAPGVIFGLEVACA